MEVVAKHKEKLMFLLFSCVLLDVTFCDAVTLEPSGVLELCPESTVSFVCTITEGTVLSWSAHNEINGVDADTMIFTSQGTAVGTQGSVGIFVVRLISKSPLVSEANLTSSFDVQLNGTTLICANTVVSNPAPSQMKTTVLTLKDPPSAPFTPEFMVVSLANTILSWATPPDPACILTSFIVTLTNITEGSTLYVYNTITNATSMMVSDLVQGAEYTFNVAGVDIGDRVGWESVPSESVTFDTPERVTGLVTYSQDNSINITWMPPPPSSRPPVTGYKINHNITGSVVEEETNDTSFAFDDPSPGVYVVSVWAINALGDGEKDIIIAVVSSDDIMNPTGTVTSSLSDASSLQVASTTTASTETTASSDQLLVYVFAAFGVITIVISIMAVLLIVLLILFVRNRKGIPSRNSEPSHAEEKYNYRNMTYKDNEAYVSGPVAMSNIMPQDANKPEPLYETVK